MGVRLVQGPIINSPGDTALVSGRKIPDRRNLSMSAFWEFINGGDPIKQEPLTGQELFNNLSGRDRDGNPLIDPTSNSATRYWYSGDPIMGDGWLEQENANNRFMMSSGPFQMADGDTQKIAIALIMTLGDSALHSLQLLKETSVAASQLYGQFEETYPGPKEPPGSFELSQNYPTPFNASTTIRYMLSAGIARTLPQESISTILSYNPASA